VINCLDDVVVDDDALRMQSSLFIGVIRVA
jgi:hypothetical protein